MVERSGSPVYLPLPSATSAFAIGCASIEHRPDGYLCLNSQPPPFQKDGNEDNSYKLTAKPPLGLRFDGCLRDDCSAGWRGIGGSPHLLRDHQCGTVDLDGFAAPHGAGAVRCRTDARGHPAQRHQHGLQPFGGAGSGSAGVDCRAAESGIAALPPVADPGPVRGAVRNGRRGSGQGGELAATAGVCDRFSGAQQERDPLLRQRAAGGASLCDGDALLQGERDPAFCAIDGAERSGGAGVHGAGHQESGRFPAAAACGVRQECAREAGVYVEPDGECIFCSGRHCDGLRHQAALQRQYHGHGSIHHACRAVGNSGERHRGLSKRGRIGGERPKSVPGAGLGELDG